MNRTILVAALLFIFTMHVLGQDILYSKDPPPSLHTGVLFATSDTTHLSNSFLRTDLRTLFKQKGEPYEDIDMTWRNGVTPLFSL